VKLIPGAHPFHAIAEAAWTAAIEHYIVPERVSRAIISAPQLKVWASQAVQPHDLIGAAHSVPYFVAASLVDRRFGWDHFDTLKMQDARIAALLPRISFDPNPPPHPDRFPHRHGGTVTIELDDGRVIRSTCKAPRGSGARGIDWADVDDKFRQLVPAGGLGSLQVEDSLALIHDLDRAGAVTDLMQQLRPVGDLR